LPLLLQVAQEVTKAAPAAAAVTAAVAAGADGGVWSTIRGAATSAIDTTSSAAAPLVASITGAYSELGRRAAPAIGAAATQTLSRPEVRQGLAVAGAFAAMALMLWQANRNVNEQDAAQEAAAAAARAPAAPRVPGEAAAAAMEALRAARERTAAAAPAPAPAAPEAAARAAAAPAPAPRLKVAAGIPSYPLPPAGFAFAPVAPGGACAVDLGSAGASVSAARERLAAAVPVVSRGGSAGLSAAVEASTTAADVLADAVRHAAGGVPEALHIAAAAAEASADALAKAATKSVGWSATIQQQNARTAATGAADVLRNAARAVLSGTRGAPLPPGASAADAMNAAAAELLRVSTAAAAYGEVTAAFAPTLDALERLPGAVSVGGGPGLAAATEAAAAAAVALREAARCAALGDAGVLAPAAAAAAAAAGELAAAASKASGWSATPGQIAAASAATASANALRAMAVVLTPAPAGAAPEPEPASPAAPATPARTIRVPVLPPPRATVVQPPPAEASVDEEGVPTGAWSLRSWFGGRPAAPTARIEAPRVGSVSATLKSTTAAAASASEAIASAGGAADKMAAASEAVSKVAVALLSSAEGAPSANSEFLQGVAGATASLADAVRRAADDATWTAAAPASALVRAGDRINAAVAGIRSTARAGAEGTFGRVALRTAAAALSEAAEVLSAAAVEAEESGPSGAKMAAVQVNA
jgi:hypothetical protein